MESPDVLVLGSTGGIGSAISDYFEQQGHRVYKPTRPDFDIRNKVELKNIDNIKVVVNCIGINPTKIFEDIDRRNFQNVIDTNFLGMFDVIKQVSLPMKKNGGGYILNISSLYGHLSREGRLMYSTTKHAANGMIKTFAIELGKHNIKVNSLSPGFVMTNMTTKNNSKEKIESWKSKIPLGKLATPEDIASVAYFLCSEDNKYITGQNIIVDGGYSIGGFEA